MNDTIDRLKLFRSLKTSVRGSENYLLVGIDIANMRAAGKAD